MSQYLNTKRWSPIVCFITSIPLQTHVHGLIHPYYHQLDHPRVLHLFLKIRMVIQPPWHIRHRWRPKLRWSPLIIAQHCRQYQLCHWNRQARTRPQGHLQRHYHVHLAVHPQAEKQWQRPIAPLLLLPWLIATKSIVVVIVRTDATYRSLYVELWYSLTYSYTYWIPMCIIFR